MDETYISFYLKANRIHVFIEALRMIGSPKRICFMISEDGKKLLMAPYRKRDFRSHGVPNDVYNGIGRMEISSMKLCRLTADLYSWNLEHSYRVPGLIREDHNVILFDLQRAEEIASKTCWGI